MKDPSGIMYTAQYDEHNDIGTQYKGMPKMKRQDGLKAEHKASIMEDCTLPGKLLDGTVCKILLYMRESKSLCLKPFI